MDVSAWTESNIYWLLLCAGSACIAICTLAATDLITYSWPGLGPDLFDGPRMTLSCSSENQSLQNMSSGSASPVGELSLDEHPRKLAVLGLPWETRYVGDWRLGDAAECIWQRMDMRN